MAATVNAKSAPRKRAAEVLARLGKRYENPTSALVHHNPWELLVATVLAAQCTDERVNKVTPELFERWPDPAALAQADQGAIEEVIHSTGFFRNKAKNLKAAARMVENDYGGELPKSLAELTKLPGVARKTANIILGHAFGINEGVAVDTHVKRLSYRLGFTESQDVKRIERDLMEIIPQDRWGDINHYLVFLGREICNARKPLCPECPLEDICPKNGV